MKHWFVLLASGFFCIVSQAATCEENLASQFKQVTQTYYTSALVKDAKEMEHYFNFPLKLLGSFDGDKPTIISKKFFLKNYSLMFIKNKVTEHTDFYLDFHKMENDAMGSSEVRYLKGFCEGRNISPPEASFGPFIYQWFQKSGWKITAIYYSTDDKDNLFESVKNPDLEYAFP